MFNWYKIAQQMSIEDAWSTLALSNADLDKPNALQKAKKQYRKMIRKYHPDVYKGNADANELSQKFNKAIKVIEDWFKLPEYARVRSKGQNGAKGWTGTQRTRTQPSNDPFDPNNFWGFGSWGGKTSEERQRENEEYRRREEEEERARMSYFDWDKYEKYASYILGETNAYPYSNNNDSKEVNLKRVIENVSISYLAKQYGFERQGFIDAMQKLISRKLSHWNFEDIFNIIHQMTSSAKGSNTLLDVIESARKNVAERMREIGEIPNVLSTYFTEIKYVEYADYMLWLSNDSPFYKQKGGKYFENQPISVLSSESNYNYIVFLEVFTKIFKAIFSGKMPAEDFKNNLNRIQQVVSKAVSDPQSSLYDIILTARGVFKEIASQQG